jgi:hypothetical protein
MANAPIPRVQDILGGAFSGQNKPPATLGSPSDRGPKPAGGGKNDPKPGKIGMAIRKPKKPKLGGDNPGLSDYA